MRWPALLAFMLVSLVSTTSLAQLGELRPVSAGYEYYAPVSFRPNGSKLAFDTYRANAGFPFALTPKTFIIPSVGYQLVHAHNTGEQSGSTDLHNITVGHTLARSFSDRWFGILMVNFGVASNLAGPLTGADLYVSGNVIAMYKIGSAFSIGAGVAYDRRTGSITPVPLGALYWEPVRNFAVRGVIPSSAYVTWRPATLVTLELMSALDGQRFHLSDRSWGDRDASVAYSLVKVGAGARVHFGKLAHLELLGGAVVARRFELFVDDRSDAGGTIPPAPFFGVNLWLGTSGWQSDLPRPPEKTKTQ